MKNSKILSVLSVLMLSGCAFSDDALFPSLFGTEAQENTVKEQQTNVQAPVGESSFKPVEIKSGEFTGTFVGQKVISFRNELSRLQSAIKNYDEQLQDIRQNVTNNAIAYHEVIGNIEAKLQVGTTPGNPKMYALLNEAQNNIQTLDKSSAAIAQLSEKVVADSAMTDYLLGSIRAAYGVSGAVDEDHRQLKILETEANQTAFLFTSLSRELEIDAMRQKQYIEAARNYLTDLRSAVKVGSFISAGSAPVAPTIKSSKRKPLFAQKLTMRKKPLAVVKFNKEDVDYKPAISQAVNAAMNRKPNAEFEVVAVSPAGGSMASKIATKNNATEVFNFIIQQGVSADKISISAKTSEKVKSAEVQVFVK